MIKVYAQKSGRELTLTEKIGEGGEGGVFAHPHAPQSVCKIYHADVLKKRGGELHRKLTAMIDAPPEDPMLARGFPMFAWPTEILFDSQKRSEMVGFVMPRVQGFYPIHNLYSATDRKQIALPVGSGGKPLLEYKLLVRTARNLARAFELLHVCDYVMVDVNETNILFRPDGAVVFIDNDSFQVQSSEEYFLTNVWVAEYWPSDSVRLQENNQPLSTVHDRFALGIFLFRLLMDGTHPFQGISPPGEDRSLARNIALGHTPFFRGREGGLRPPPSAPSFQSLPPAVQECFRRCFVNGLNQSVLRPSAQEWVSVLDSVEPTLVGCAKGHLYFPNSSGCPWCAVAADITSCKAGHTYYRSTGSCPLCELAVRRAKRGTTVVPSAGSAPIPAPTPTPPTPVVATPVATPVHSGLPLGVRLKRVVSFILLLAGVVWAFGGFAPIAPFIRKPNAPNISNVPTEPSISIEPTALAYPNMVKIPAGSFLMGSTTGESDEQPMRRVQLSRFSMSENVITVSQYEAYCKATRKDMFFVPSFNEGWRKKDHPIVNVSWNDAKAFCVWLSKKLGKTYDLPTEAEWEYASRGGLEGKAYPWGDVWDASKCANSTNTNDGTVAVGSYPANGYGLRDMSGNVWQWCNDFYIDRYNARDANNPKGASSGTVRVLRGGSWFNSVPNLFRCTDRNWYDPGVRDGCVGFRVVSR